MSKIILAASQFISEHCITDRWIHLSNILIKDHGYKLHVFEESQDLDISDVDTVLMFAVPRYSKVYLGGDVYKRISANPNIKLIVSFEDIQDVRTVEMKEYLDRCDLILSWADSKFRDIYPSYINKFKFFPNSFAPHERYLNLAYNENPINKCLLPGNHTKSYELRNFIQRANKNYIDIITHKGVHRAKAEGVMDHDKFASHLNKYRCCATTPVHTGLVTKIFEIPAAGSLLITEHSPDLKLLGFKEDYNYIRIDKGNCFQKIEDVIKNSNSYEDIRRRGYELAIKNHSVKNRAEELIKLINELG